VQIRPCRGGAGGDDVAGRWWCSDATAASGRRWKMACGCGSGRRPSPLAARRSEGELSAGWLGGVVAAPERRGGAVVAARPVGPDLGPVGPIWALAG
jgi:hypothetical protein